MSRVVDSGPVHLINNTQTWQQHPDTLVGFFPRSHTHQSPQSNDQGEKDDDLWEYLYFWRYGVSILDYGSSVNMFVAEYTFASAGGAFGWIMCVYADGVV